MADAELGVVLRHIRTLAGSRVLAEASDGQLLEQFARCREEAAFALLLRRAGVEPLNYREELQTMLRSARLLAVAGLDMALGYAVASRSQAYGSFARA